MCIRDSYNIVIKDSTLYDILCQVEDILLVAITIVLFYLLIKYISSEYKCTTGRYSIYLTAVGTTLTGGMNYEYDK